MKFQIPRQQKPTKERIDVKLEVEVLTRLDRYCQYMESDRDYVIGTVLRIVFKKDKGFTEWLRSVDRQSESAMAVDATDGVRASTASRLRA